MALRVFLIAGAMLLASPASAQQIITTFAGGGPDNIPALATGLETRAVAVDSQGNLFVVAGFDVRIFRIDAVTGILTLYAGNGTQGNSPNGTAAKQASFGNISDIAVDSQGNVLLADRFQNCIRRIRNDLLETVAGICTSSGFSIDGTLATAARLNQPFSIAIDANDLVYIADSGNARVRRVDADLRIRTVAGSGAFGYGGDGGPATAAAVRLNGGVRVAVSPAGALYIADSTACRIRQVVGGTISTLAGTGICNAAAGDGGPAAAAQFLFPADVATDASGNVFVADVYRVRRIDHSSPNVISTVAGDGTSTFNADGNLATAGGLGSAYRLGVDNLGRVLASESQWYRLRRIEPTGVISTVAGNGSPTFSGDGYLATRATLNFPNGVALDQAGNLYIQDSTHRRIRRVDATGVIDTVAGSGLCLPALAPGVQATSAGICSLLGLASDSAGNLFFTTGTNYVWRVDRATGLVSAAVGTGGYGFSGDGSPASGATLSLPGTLSTDPSGNLYIWDANNRRVRRVDAVSGVITTVAGNGSIAASYGGDGPATNRSLGDVTGLAADANGNLFIAFVAFRRVVRVDATGHMATIAGNGVNAFGGDGGPAVAASLYLPTAVAVDGVGNVFIATGGRVRAIDTSGIIRTVAGSSDAPGFGGDGGPPTSARLATSLALLVDPMGALFIADTYNDRIRRVSPPYNTLAGTNVEVQPAVTLPGGSSTTVSLEFASVLTSGNTSATASAAGPPPPNGFKLGQPPVYYDLTTTATFAGLVNVCFSWTQGQFANENHVRLFHYEAAAWVDVTTTVDTVANIICGLTTSLSPFAIAETAYTFLGFAPPLLANGSASIQQGNQGRTIPVSFRLERFGLPVTTAVATIAVFRVTDVGTGTVDTTNLTEDSGQSADNGNRFRADQGQGHYIFNLSTRGFTAPATYCIVVTLDDGSVHKVNFTLR